MISQVYLACHRFGCKQTFATLTKLRNGPNNVDVQRSSVLPVDLVAINSSEIYSFSQQMQTWRNVGSIDSGIGCFGAELIGSQLYMFGGFKFHTHSTTADYLTDQTGNTVCVL